MSVQETILLGLLMPHKSSNFFCQSSICSGQLPQLLHLRPLQLRPQQQKPAQRRTLPRRPVFGMRTMI